MLTLPNYQIGTQIYESVNSLVYQGVRNEDNQPVILKMLKEDYPTPAELTRYRQEYEITHDLNSNGIIKVYDVEKYQNTLVIILEDFGGNPLKQLIIERPLTVKEFLPFAIQMADSLGNIHAANIIHKDINPSNIVWEPVSKQLKIIDFGIASRLPRENPTLKNPEQLEGTLAYLSPEQTGRINRSMDYRTDLYSLGITFYELLTGQLPFTATDAMELVHCHIAKIPSPIHEVNPDIPNIVSAIVMKLLAKNAEDRYQSAFGLKIDLEKCLALSNKRFGDKLSSTQFELAQNDFSEKFEIPQKLYGRNNEVDVLLQAFDRVSNGNTEMMLVAGYSGVGKTALVHEVHKPMTEKRGYFAAGKFDQFQKNIPYSAITQAFNEFCRYLLMEKDLNEWQTKILDAVGNNGQIIIDVVPDLELVIGKQPAVIKVGATEAQNRFQMFFMNFVKALAGKEHPFILFIDDLQWVDSASLGLLKTIMLDDEIRHLLIIGAYRDNEVDSSHPFVMAVSELEKTNAIINTIELANLLGSDVNHLLQESLSCETGRSQPLTDLIYQKTQGNAFFTHQFLQMLYFEALLWFDFEQHQWHWDVEQITAQNITANVVELMANKIEKLPSSTSAALQLAACIGNQFDLSILAIIYEQDQNETLSALHPAITKELIQPLDENYKHLETAEKSQFKFLHDRVQQAAYALIDGEQKQGIHLQIGRLLLENTSKSELEERIFDIVNQLNKGQQLIDDVLEKLKLAELNFKAGRKAKLSTAYEPALHYLQTTQELLPAQTWQKHYEFSFKINLEIAECYYLTGNFEQTDLSIATLLDNVISATDKVKVYMLEAYKFHAESNFPKALEVEIAALRLLGMEIPEDSDELQKLVWLKQKETEALIEQVHWEQLPIMTDLQAKQMMPLLDGAVTRAINIGNREMYALLTLKMLELTIQFGNTDESALGCIFYATLKVSHFENYEQCFLFQNLATELANKFDNKSVNAQVYFWNGLINHWKYPLRSSFELFWSAYRLSMESGNLIYATYVIWHLGKYHVICGDNFDSVHQNLDDFLALMTRLKNSYVFDLIEVDSAFIKVMSSSNRQEVESHFIENSAMNKYSGNFLYETAYSLQNFKALYFFEQHEAAFKIVNKYIDSFIIAFPYTLYVTEYMYFYSLIVSAIYPSLSEQDQQQALEKITVFKKHFKCWSENCPENFLHWYLLLEAETAHITGEQMEKTVYFYDQAIISAKNNGFIQDEALGNELAAKFWLAKDKPDFADLYLKKAHYLYGIWGATAKVKDLETRYPQFLSPKTTNAISMDTTISLTRTASTSTTGSSEWLDLNSVMKAAQTLSGEIILSRLLEKMMHIVIENAGASIGFLLLPKQDSWFIEAQGQIDSDEVKVLQSFPIENQSLAETVIHYVIRTQENVVLKNASVEGQFIRDPYIVKQRPKSVLCMPLLNQGHITGILYLENNLTTGAFTSERIKVLNLLSSQIAISIENARLYRSITRFLPSEFLSLLDKKNIIDVQLGDQVEKEMSILFADIRDFTSLSEKMTPQENFNFINAYLGRMETVITQHHGFIDKYIGDAIMALFPANADEAVSASIAMLKKLATYNQERQESSLEPIAIGIGLNTGLLMLGTVGGENRMDGTVISDAVNLASRIEGMTKMYGAALLISEETYAHLNDVSQYAIRTIDRVKVKGKSEPVTVYEVFDGDAAHLAELKTKTRDDFEKGLAHYRQKTFTEAILCFEQVLRTHPDDKAAQIYLGRCQHWQKFGVPDDWEGVEALDSK